MRTTWSLPRCLSLLSLSTVAPLVLTVAVRAQIVTNTQIDYTGNLLGYYRMEPTEQTAVLPPVKAFLDYRDADAKGTGGRHLLLGMGDNFGPEFGASLQLENTTDKECARLPKDPGNGETKPESLYKDDDRVTRLPQCDNVLNFLMHAGFRGVVPGREDFMYTARWLRTAAVQLARASNAQGGSPLIKNDDHQLYLLAANLRLQLKGDLRLKHAPGPDARSDAAYSLNGRCPLLFTNDPFAPDSPPCVANSADPQALDWLDRLDRLSVTNGQNPTTAAMRQLATDAAITAAGRDSVLKQLVSDELNIMQSAWGSMPEVQALFGKSVTGERNAGAGKPPSGKQADPSSGKGNDLSPTGVASLISLLGDLTGSQTCQPGAGFANNAEGANTGDMCKYAIAMEGVVKEFADQLKASSENKTIAACKADDGSSSVGACFLLTEPARQAATNGLLRTIAKEQKDVGYTVAAQADGQKVLVIGVVGQNTMKEVSETNLRLCIGLEGKNGKDYPESQAAKDDPDSVLDGDHWPGDFGICYQRTSQQLAQNSFSAAAVATDPVVISAALVRAAELVEGRFNGVVLMAQMPHTEAEVLAARVWEKLATTPAQQPISIVLSEAGETETGSDASTTETGYDTPDLTLNFVYRGRDYNAENTGHPPPVLTPFNGYPNPPDGRFPGAVSRATVQWTQGQKLEITNQSTGIYPIGTPSTSANTTSTAKTAIELLYELMSQIQGKPIDYKDNPNNRQKAELMLLADLQQAVQPRAPATRHHADVVMLQSRDVQLGPIQAAYQDYNMCTGDANLNLCKLRVALDRIFWKGDYLEYVAVTGKDIETILGQSEAMIEQQNELTETDISQEWLVSYGIVQSALANPTVINQNNEPLWIPVDPTCEGESANKSTYCIAQTPIVDDAYYWLVTTDQLAEDRAVYGTLNQLSSANHVETETFITAPIAHYLLSSLSNTRLASVTAAPGADPAGGGSPGGGAVTQSVEAAITAQNESFQQRRLLQVDFAKLIASFTARQPVGGNTSVQQFQGVIDTRATTPASQDLDLEMGSRVLVDLRVPDAASTRTSTQNRSPWSVGLTSTFTYNRAVLGNLLNKPINAAYSLNSWTEGAFLQVRLYGKGKGSQVRGVRSLPRSLLVFTPHQYQVEVDHPYLFFTYTPSAGSGELTVKLPRTTAWTDRAGFREEFGQTSSKALFHNGSFIETGMEFFDQNSALSAITLQTTSASGAKQQKTCPVSATITLPLCFSTADAEGPVLTINSTTTLVGSPAVKSLHIPGYYWTMHLQNRMPQFLGKSPDRQISLVTDTSSGDFYFGRPPAAELPSQTEYAIPLSLSLVLPSIGNLSFAPNYSAFFYRPQLSSPSLIVNSWSLSARWYFARDARVPIRQQAPLHGPASEDQTKTGTAH